MARWPTSLQFSEDPTLKWAGSKSNAEPRSRTGRPRGRAPNSCVRKALRILSSRWWKRAARAQAVAVLTQFNTHLPRGVAGGRNTLPHHGLRQGSSRALVFHSVEFADRLGPSGHSGRNERSRKARAGGTRAGPRVQGAVWRPLSRAFSICGIASRINSMSVRRVRSPSSATVVAEKRTKAPRATRPLKFIQKICACWPQ